jgi:hypothetical protein
MPVVMGDQLGGYVELVIRTPNGTFKMNGDGGEYTADSSVQDLGPLLQFQSAEVSMGISMIPEINFEAFVPADYMALVLDSQIANYNSEYYLRFVGSSGQRSPWWGGITGKPGVSIDDGGAQITFNSKGVSAKMAEVGARAVAADQTVKSYIDGIFKELKLANYLVFEADPTVKVAKPFVLSRPSFWHDLVAFLAEYEMFVINDLEQPIFDRPLVSKITIKNIKDLVGDAKAPIILRYRPGANIGDQDDGTTILPILSFKCDADVLWTPGMGDASVVGFNRNTMKYEKLLLTSVKDSATKASGDGFVLDDPSLTDLIPPTEKRSGGGFLNVQGALHCEVLDVDSAGGGAEKAKADLTKRHELAGFEAEIGTVGALIPPGTRVYVDGICKKFDGSYFVRTVVHSASGPWETSLGLVKLGDKTETEAKPVDKDPGIPTSGAGSEKSPTQGAGV